MAERPPFIPSGPSGRLLTQEERDDINRLVLRYVEREEAERDEGITPRALHKALANLNDRMTDHEKEDREIHEAVRERLKEHGTRIGHVESTIADHGDRLRTLADDTGRHELTAKDHKIAELVGQLEEMKKAKAAARSEGFGWRQGMWLAFFGALFMVALEIAREVVFRR